MSNPLYDQYGHVNQDIVSRFQQFRNSFQGDPRQIVQQMLNRGQITQEQLNVAMQKANQMMRFMK